MESHPDNDQALRDDVISWHKHVLIEREFRLLTGEESFEDWDVAKQLIKEEVSRGPRSF